MGDLSDVLSRKLNLRNGQKLTTKKFTESKRANETDDDVAILSMIMPGEKFECLLRHDCRMGNYKENSLGKLHESWKMLTICPKVIPTALEQIFSFRMHFYNCQWRLQPLELICFSMLSLYLSWTRRRVISFDIKTLSCHISNISSAVWNCLLKSYSSLLHLSHRSHRRVGRGTWLSGTKKTKKK